MNEAPTKLTEGHMVVLPEWMEAEYAARALGGKTIPDLIVRDLGEYAESKRFYANEREKVHP